MDRSNQRGGYRLHIRSRSAPQHLRQKELSNPRSNRELESFPYNSLSRGIGGEKWAQEEMAKHTAALDGKKPHEIQKHCFDYVLDAQDQIVTDEMRTFAYENGHPMGVILMVLAIELRDALTQKRHSLK